MSEPLNGRGARTLVIEFLVIAIGVFIALAAESWWSEREDRLRESDIREDMLAEFAANIRILEADIQTNENMARRFARLPAMTEEELISLPDAFFEENYRLFPNWAGFDPEMGIVQALVNSGNLSSISNREFRLRLSRWAGLLKEKDRKTLQATQFQINSLMPVIAEVSADARWSTAERRRAQLLYETLSVLQRMVLENQVLLHAEAQSIHAYLTGST